MQRQPGTRRCDRRRRYIAGFTLIEVLVVTSIVAILSAILFPTYVSAKRSALQVRDLSNLRQVGIAVTMYASDYDDCVPPCKENLISPDEVTWIGAVQPYTRTKLLTRSPFDDSPAWADPVRPRLTSYGLNAYFDFGHPPYFGVRLGQAERPAETVLSMPLNVNLKGSAQAVLGDHFMPMYYGNPAHVENAKFQSLQWDASTGLPRMTDIGQCFGRADTLFADGHVRATRFETTWRQRAGEPPDRDLYDPLRVD